MTHVRLAVALLCLLVLTSGGGGLLPDLTPVEKLADVEGLHGLWVQPVSDRPQDVVGSRKLYGLFEVGNFKRTTLTADITDPAILAWRDKVEALAPCFSVVQDGRGDTIQVSDATTLEEALALVKQVQGG